ncbi:MAG TPA: hypothetical protein VFZ01_10870 [Geminicoccaceae bacterium]
MAELLHEVEGAGPDELVLEVHRVEDARTVTQRLHVPGDAWRPFLELPASATVDDAYAARRGFWDWLAEEYADTMPGTPSDPGASGTPTPDAGWLRDRHAEWQAEH